MRVVIALHSPIGSNSGRHVDGFAHHLVALGVEVVVAVPDLEDGDAEATRRYLLVHHDDVLDLPAPDLLHVWTPRHVITELVRRAQGAWGPVPVVVHLEDGERHLTEVFTGRSWDELRADPDHRPPPHLTAVTCVPADAEALLAGAAGATCIVDALLAAVPPGVRATTLWPGVDAAAFGAPVGEARARLGLPPDDVLLAYPGNVHAANRDEVGELLAAVALLRAEGRPARLVRTGSGELGDAGDAGDAIIDLGMVDAELVPHVCAAADVLVQPGAPGPFNDLRLPSKVPEFLASGRPVVLPATNIGLVLRHRREALVLPVADAPAIAAAVAEVLDHPRLARRLSRRGRRFARRRLAWADRAEVLLAFYRRVLDGDPP
jgi:glycosyltransferase involved in cell wall biosynthesis